MDISFLIRKTPKTPNGKHKNKNKNKNENSKSQSQIDSPSSSSPSFSFSKYHRHGHTIGFVLIVFQHHASNLREENHFRWALPASPQPGAEPGIFVWGGQVAILIYLSRQPHILIYIRFFIVYTLFYLISYRHTHTKQQ